MKAPPKRKGNPARAFQSSSRISASMKAPPKRKGNHQPPAAGEPTTRLNESPSEKEGKFANHNHARLVAVRLNESPSEKEGKLCRFRCLPSTQCASMKAPPKRKGNWMANAQFANRRGASMKAPPKRKGNPGRWSSTATSPARLNESPSEKEGK